MKTQTVFRNASLVSVVNGSIVVKDSTGREHTFTNASVVSVNNGTIIIESEWEPKRGELVKITTIDLGIRYAIFKRFEDYQFWMYCASLDKLTCLPIDCDTPKWYNKNFISRIDPVTPEEQKEFDDFCKSQGKIWNKETLQWEKYKWEPELGATYYYIDLEFSDSVGIHIYNKDGIDLCNYEHYNCFQTEKQAREAAEKVKELLKSL